MFITEGLPQEMKPADYGTPTVFRPRCPDHVMDLPQTRQPQQLAVRTSRHLPDRSTNPRCSDKRAVRLDGKDAQMMRRVPTWLLVAIMAVLFAILLGLPIALT